MMDNTRFKIFAVILLSACIAVPQNASPQSAFRRDTQDALKTLSAARPYQDNNGIVPPRTVYSGPLFKLNTAWPTKPLPDLVDPPWQKAIQGGQINTQNAKAYADALKAAVAVNGRQLIMHYDTWDAAKARWYNEPWTGSIRESIRGTYPAGEFGPGIFPNTGLRATFNTHVLTYYDERAANTLFKIWGTSAMKPDVQTDTTQFAEGSIIVKAAVFASVDPKQRLGWWNAMYGAQVWNLYLPVPPPSPGQPTSPSQLWPGFVAQFDIIVKDSKSAPKTGWVMMTLVYDSSVSGDAWDRMVPLGVQWGNDPQATKAGMPLVENWNNPKAPLYSTQTLGFGGRLSGPNDGGRNNIAVNGVVMNNTPDSSCFSCHSTAQWNVAEHKMDSFLLPSFATSEPPGFQLCGADGKPDQNGQNICSPAPGSAEWMKWFQNRLGTEPMDQGSVAADFDEVLSFKSLKLWWVAVGPANQPMPLLTRLPETVGGFNQYTGAPLPHKVLAK